MLYTLPPDAPVDIPLSLFPHTTLLRRTRCSELLVFISCHAAKISMHSSPRVHLEAATMSKSGDCFSPELKETMTVQEVSGSRKLIHRLCSLVLEAHHGQQLQGA